MVGRKIKKWIQDSHSSSIWSDIWYHEVWQSHFVGHLCKLDYMSLFQRKMHSVSEIVDIFTKFTSVCSKSTPSCGANFISVAPFSLRLVYLTMFCIHQLAQIASRVYSVIIACYYITYRLVDGIEAWKHSHGRQLQYISIGGLGIGISLGFMPHEIHASHHMIYI